MPPPGVVAAGVVDVLQSSRQGAPALLVVPRLVHGLTEPAETRQRSWLLLLVHGFVWKWIFASAWCCALKLVSLCRWMYV